MSQIKTVKERMDEAERIRATDEILRLREQLEAVTKERDSLHDAIAALKEFVDCDRNDPEAIAAIINGALKLK